MIWAWLELWAMAKMGMLRLNVDSDMLRLKAMIRLSRS